MTESTDSLRLFVDGFASEYFKSYILLEIFTDSCQPDFYGSFLDLFHEYSENGQEFTSEGKTKYLDNVYNYFFNNIQKRYEEIGQRYNIELSLPQDKPASYNDCLGMIESLRKFEKRCMQ